MKRMHENIMAAIFLILLAVLLLLALGVSTDSVQDPVRQQIKNESMIT